MGSADWSVLVVDDDPMIVRALSFLLEDLGFLSCTAASGAEAIATARDQSDGKTVAVIDLNLGAGMNGIETIGVLHHSLGIPCILTTGTSTDEVASLATVAGAVAVLQKPFTAETLKKALDRAVEKT